MCITETVSIFHDLSSVQLVDNTNNAGFVIKGIVSVHSNSKK